MSTVALLMLKAPIPGNVKTRLAADIGDEQACTIYKKLVEHTLANIPKHWQTCIQYTPTEALPLFHQWLGKSNYNYVPQPEGNLGDRMSHAVTNAFENGATTICLLGGDCPYLTPELLNTAEATLAHADIALGPTPDGGYYTLLTRKPELSLFQKIAWSTDTVLQQTLAQVDSLHWKAHLLPTHEDVDDASSWARAQKSIA